MSLRKAPRTALGQLMRDKRDADPGFSYNASTGIPRTMYAAIEGGRRRPSAQYAVKVAAWLGLTPARVYELHAAPNATHLPAPKAKPTALGNAMRAHRGEVSQLVTAYTMGIAQITFCMIENGQSFPGDRTAILLAEWLGWSEEQVLSAAGPRPRKFPARRDVPVKVPPMNATAVILAELTYGPAYALDILTRLTERTSGRHVLTERALRDGISRLQRDGMITYRVNAGYHARRWYELTDAGATVAAEYRRALVKRYGL